MSQSPEGQLSALAYILGFPCVELGGEKTGGWFHQHGQHGNFWPQPSWGRGKLGGDGCFGFNEWDTLKALFVGHR